MAINYTWNVATVDTKPSVTDDNAITETDVIYNVHWRLTGTDDTNTYEDENGDDVNYTADVYGTQTLDISDLGSFTAFDDVTASDVEGWVTTAMGTDEVQNLKDAVAAKITEAITPTSETKTIG
tara:strand:- start:5776 stop:6147 length:372 start_codon:yes stop_codon:yes gene_type:complete